MAGVRDTETQFRAVGRRLAASFPPETQSRPGDVLDILIREVDRRLDLKNAANENTAAPASREDGESA